MLHRRGRALGAGLPVPGGCLELGLQASFVWLVLILRIGKPLRTYPYAVRTAAELAKQVCNASLLKSRQLPTRVSCLHYRRNKSLSFGFSPCTAEASDAGAALKAGDAAFAKGEFTAAVGLYTRAVQADSKGLLPLTKRAAAHGKLGEHRSALRDLDQALHLDSSSVQALLYRCGLARLLI